MPPAGRRSRARLDAQRRAASRAAPAERLRRSPSPRLPPGALQRRAGSSCGSQGPPVSRPVAPPAETPVGAPKPPAVPREASSTKRRPLQGVGLSQASAGSQHGACGTRGTAAVLLFLPAPQASGPPMRRPHPCAHLSLCLLWTHGRTRLLIQFLFYDDADEGEVE
ncbi:class A basic helix-loop-helix protein 9-like isoform X1 [Vulpes lagopus]|uniref:class A basic helix-loop-helix protein 9-like isoform X1 n=1 Tax=Vulpes lagopus TaxID=494514 RepID=UPI001BC8E1C6|nr:class A basic helix-loop-helix protein 9-like isoform X1 [Vulpes lagopus]